MRQSNEVITKDVLASKWLRLANFILDYIVIIIFSAMIGVVIGLYSELTGNYDLYNLIVLNDSVLVDYAFTISIWLVYYTTMETLTERSLAKFITKTKVVLQDGSKPTFSKIFVRTLCRFIPFEAFSFIGEDAYGWHDSISKTYVVNINKYEAHKATLEGLEEIGRIGD